jgi:divalent metal cation (Fe/Co/Zn/Cd) transporter
VELTLHVRVPRNKTVEEADRIAKLIENAVREKLGWEATVHVEGEKAKSNT